MKICESENCLTQAVFNLPDKKGGLWCKKHAPLGAVNVMDKTCKDPDCKTLPSYNLPGKKGRVWCSKHAPPEAIDIHKKTCKDPDCLSKPYFNLPNLKIGLWCSKHAPPEAIDINKKTCKDPDCDIRASYNLPEEKVPLWCSKHSPSGSIITNGKICKDPDCDIVPSYNLPEEKNGLWCLKHSPSEAINVVSRICLETACSKQSSFNLYGEKIALWCKNHSEVGHVNLFHKRCLSKGCDIIVSKKYKGYCCRCFIYTFPDVKISRNYKIKEIHMTDFIKDNFETKDWIFDKTLGGCSGRRPDVAIDMFTHVIIIECDENQHINEEYTRCDNKRMMELFQDCKNRPMIFIRFNPDSYLLHGKKVESCFKTHKRFHTPLPKKELWAARLTVLKQSIDKWITTIPDKEITIEHLFYDN